MLLYKHRFGLPVEPGRYQMLVGSLCEMAFLSWFYNLAMCLYTLIWKRRISHGTSDSQKGVHVWSHFHGWKIRVMNLGSESKRKHTGLFPKIVVEI